jgi:HD-GYP domain
MEKLSLKELAVPVIKAIDSCNYLLKSHHRRTAVIAYHIGKKMGLEQDQLFSLVISAAIHDVGALSVQERDLLVREDVQNPRPHCDMGCKMLSSFAPFADVARVIKYHHIRYAASLDMPEGEVLLESYILHLADRVDIVINPDVFVLKQKSAVVEKIRANVGTVFHPHVFEAFVAASVPDIFWIEINNLELDQLFRRVDSSLNFALSLDNILEFALTISRIIDFRSHFTASHSYTVANLACEIGKIFGFSRERCLKLKISGYLHDIGKIGIDPGLIEKNGPLTDDEFDQVKLHTYYTGQILSSLSISEWFNEIVVWAQNHHEKTDGSGYPYSLQEENLDTGCKILAFSDVIAALMEDRPYRKRLSIDTAFEIIRDKLAAKISSPMFEVLAQHKQEINAIVEQSHKNVLSAYRSEM